MELILDASSEEIHYVEGWLEAPAHIDLSLLSLLTTEEPDFDHGDDWFREDDEFAVDDAFEFDDEFELDTSSPTPVPGDFATTTPEPSSDGDVDTTSQPSGLTTPAPSQLATPSPSELTTSASSEPATPAPSQQNAGDETGAEGTLTPSPSVNPDDGSATPAPSPDRRRVQEGVGAERVKQYLDVIVFMIPDDCNQNIWGGCDWTKLGVGAPDYEFVSGVSYCCTEDSASRGLCSADHVGQFIIDHDTFKGEHRQTPVPTAPDQAFQFDEPLFEITESGDYVLIIANCDDYGLEVFSLGTMEWKSVHGYLPGEKIQLVNFYAALTVIYIVLLLWYHCGTRMYQDAAIPIQKYILATMVIGFLELFFKTLDYGFWNVDGQRSTLIVWPALVFGVLKGGISRCLIVMVSMGWGVVRDSLGGTLVKIILLGMIYSGLTLLRDFLTVLAVEEIETWSLSTEEGLLDLAVLIQFALLGVNVIFGFWIVISLTGTTEYLKNMNQTSKLQRHLRLRCIFLTASLVAVSIHVFSFADGVLDILGTNQKWVTEALAHANYLFVLIGVAILWRPNSNAKDYAMQMEIPAMGEDDENELELSCVVPSAGEMDDGNDPDHPDGLRVDHGTLS